MQVDQRALGLRKDSEYFQVRLREHQTVWERAEWGNQVFQEMKIQEQA